MDRLGSAFRIKTVDFGSRVIAGWAAYHGNLDRVDDIIEPQASVKAVARLKSPADVGVFVGHDMSRLPVGIPIKVEAHPEGLYVETKVFDGPTGDDLLAAARGLREHGGSLGMSIGYRLLDGKRDRVNGKTIRRITDYSLHEYSFAASQAIANPAALVTGVKIGGSMYTVEEKGGRYHVMKDGKSLADFASEDEARGKVDALKADGKAVLPNTLPDAAFLYVQPGGQTDDEGKTVPRSYRHWRYRDADGAIDADALRAALPKITEAKAIGLDGDDLLRIKTRGRRLLDAIERGETVTDEAAEWKAGAAIDLLAVAHGLTDTAERVVTEHKALAVLGKDSKGGWTLSAEGLDAIKSLHGRLGRLIEHADLVAQGKDEEALADWWRAQFDLLEVAS